MQAIVLYGSHYGTTKAYAEYIAGALGCPAAAAQDVTRRDLEAIDTVVFGGGVYAGSIAGWSKAARLYEENDKKKWGLFVCGLADPAKQKTQSEARALFEKKLPATAAGTLPVFCLRGGIDYARLNVKHRAMMAMLIGFLKRKKDPSEEDRQLLATYGGRVDFLDLASAQPVIDAAKGT